ncbi:hypothetical protein HG530_002591 [Fusarium avenaceum]|nr:hypothetical protein HG530_002591 [Fusarium avenaceum]
MATSSSPSGAVPLGGDEVFLGMRGVGEEVVRAGNLARLDVSDLLADLDKGVAEAVELSTGLGLCGLDHESPGDGETHGRRVEAVVCQSLGNVGNLDTGGLLEGSDVKDELETGHDVVGVEEGGTSLLGKAVATHHEDVGVADRENRGAAPRSGADWSNGSAVTLATNALRVNLRMAREVRGKVRLDSDRANTGATTTVGNTEGLVEVEMADISADVTGAAETNLGVHVGTVHVDETAMLVDKVADLLDLGLEDTKGGRVCNHDASKFIRVLDALGLEILDVQVTSLSVTLDSDDLHTGHGSGGRVGAVSRNRDQANLSLVSRTSLVVGLDTAKTSELTLGTRVGLQSSSVHTGDLRQVLGERADESLVAGSLLDGGEGVDVVDAGVGDGKHLGGGVELHGARTQRNHRVDEGYILGLEVVDVSQELSLSVVLVEDGLLKVTGLSLERGGNLVVEELSLVGLKGGVEIGLGNAKDLDKVAEALERALEGHSVKENRSILTKTVGVELELALLKDKALSQAGLAPDVLSNSLKTLGTVVDRVEGGHVGKKSLGRADVAGGLLTSNMLLTSLESETQSRLAEAILGNTDETAGDLALVLLRGSEESSVGTTVAQGDTESLGVTDGDVGTKLTRGLEHGESEQVGGSAEKTLLLVDDIGEGLVVVDATVGIGVLDQGANEVTLDFADELGVIGEDIANDELDVEALSSGLQNGNVASTNEGFIDFVVLGELSHLLLDVVLGATIGRDLSLSTALIPLLNKVKTLLLPPDLRGDSLVEELLHGAHGRVENLEHLGLLARLAADVSPREQLMLVQLGAALGVGKARSLDPSGG